MIKDIVVHLSVGDKAGPAGDFAVSTAAFNAHLAGVAFLYDPVAPLTGAGYVPADIIDSQERENRAATQAAIDRFIAAAGRSGVTAEPFTPRRRLPASANSSAVWRGGSISRLSATQHRKRAVSMTSSSKPPCLNPAAL